MKLVALIVTALVLAAGYWATEHHWMWIGLIVTGGLLFLELRTPDDDPDDLAAYRYPYNQERQP